MVWISDSEVLSADVLQANYEKLVATETLSDEVRSELEEETRPQSDCVRWHLERVGRITATTIN